MFTTLNRNWLHGPHFHLWSLLAIGELIFKEFTFKVVWHIGPSIWHYRVSGHIWNVLGEVQFHTDAFIYSFNKIARIILFIPQIIIEYHVSTSVLGTGDTLVNKTMEVTDITGLGPEDVLLTSASDKEIRTCKHFSKLHKR